VHSKAALVAFERARLQLPAAVAGVPIVERWHDVAIVPAGDRPP
jgi:hypothetical protein